ncbi:MAG: hypothetical protein ACOC57_03160 [Acidobacteriota bacterium]
MDLSKEQEELYRKTFKEIEKELESIDSHIEEEIKKLKEKLSKVQERKKLLRHTYLGLAEILGIDVKSSEEDEAEVENEVDYSSEKNP